MKIYRVKAGVTEYKTDMVYKGYLAHKKQHLLYTRGEALKKARMFHGKIELFGEVPITEGKICTINMENMSKDVIELLEMIYDDDLFITADCFNTLIEEADFNKTDLSPELDKELRILDAITSNFDYVQLIPNQTN